MAEWPMDQYLYPAVLNTWIAVENNLLTRLAIPRYLEVVIAVRFIPNRRNAQFMYQIGLETESSVILVNEHRIRNRRVV